LTVAGLSLVAALSFGVAGCNKATGSVSPDSRATSAVPQESALDAFTAAVQKLNDDTVHVTMTMTGVKASGDIDPIPKKASMVVRLSYGGQDMKVNVVMVGDNLYLKVSGLPSLPDKWLHLDASQVGEGSPLGMLSKDDPTGANNLIETVVNVRRAGERGFNGTLDLTKSATADEKTLDVLGDKAKAVPFTATVDDQGRLTSTVVDLDAVNSALGKVETTYSDFGASVTVEKPAADETVEAPAEIVKAFAG